MKLNLKTSLVLVVLLSLIPAATGQANSCKIVGDWQVGQTPIPGFSSFCVNSGPFLFVCTFPSTSCPPPAAADETACNKCGGAPKAGHPINLTNGNTVITERDFQLPGLGGGSGLERIWNSKWPPTQTFLKTGLFGPNWRSTYEEKIFLGQDKYWKYSRSDGSYWSFGLTTFDGTGHAIYGIAAPAEETATLVADTDLTIWTLTFRDGSRKIFDYATGLLTSIVDRNGNTTTIAYDSNNRLTQVTDPALRVITFNYPDSTATQVSSVVSNAGTFTYQYDGGGHLIKVIYPDSTFVTFELESHTLISAVRDTDGKLLESHTYDDSSRGLTSTRALGVSGITITYPRDMTNLFITF